MSGILKGITNNQKSINVPFGYSVTRSVSIIAPEDEAMLIREIYRLFLLYKSYHKVSKEINNSENFPNHPYKFTPIKVKSILHNIFYAGHLQTISTKDYKEVYSTVSSWWNCTKWNLESDSNFKK